MTATDIMEIIKMRKGSRFELLGPCDLSKTAETIRQLVAHYLYEPLITPGQARELAQGLGFESPDDAWLYRKGLEIFYDYDNLSYVEKALLLEHWGYKPWERGKTWTRAEWLQLPEVVKLYFITKACAFREYEHGASIWIPEENCFDIGWEKNLRALSSQDDSLTDSMTQNGYGHFRQLPFWEQAKWLLRFGYMPQEIWPKTDLC